jgi:hypothetical protein
MIVHVHAWYLPGSSAGFDWYREEGHAAKAFAEDVRSAMTDPSRANEVYCCYQFEMHVEDGLSAQAITDAVDAELDDRSESSSKFWPANAKELSRAASEA